MRDLILGATFAMTITVASQAQAELLMGLAAPSTGPMAWAGEDAQRGAGLAIDDLNAQGGVLGKRITIVLADDYCGLDGGEQAVAAAEKLVSNDVAVVIGHPCSGAAISASAVYENAGILMISNAATNPRLTEQGFRNVFRVVGRDDQQGRLPGRYLAERWGEERIAILHDGQAYGRGLAQEVKRELNAHGVSEAVYDRIVPGEVNYRPIVEQMHSAGVTVVYFAGYASEAGLLLRTARDLGYDFQFVAGDGISQEDFLHVAGPAADGVLFTAWPDARFNPAAVPIVARLRAQNYEPAGAGLNAYAAVQAWARAAEQADTHETEAVAKSLRTHEFETILGTIGFDDKGDVTGIETFVWYVWKGGTYVPLDPMTLTD